MWLSELALFDFEIKCRTGNFAGALSHYLINASSSTESDPIMRRRKMSNTQLFVRVLIIINGIQNCPGITQQKVRKNAKR